MHNMVALRKLQQYSLLVLFLIVSAAAVYFGWQYFRRQGNPSAKAEEEIRSVVEKVGRLIVLPQGEQPTAATVSNPERLKEQPFFKDAKVGDKVLIYTNAKKAILYRPSENKIIEVAPLNIGPASK